jgi:hypothetical protein
VANYGLPKKYTDPGDASHAVDMLREVLGKVGNCTAAVATHSLLTLLAADSFAASVSGSCCCYTTAVSSGDLDLASRAAHNSVPR